MSSSSSKQPTASGSSSSILALKAMVAQQKASGKRELPAQRSTSQNTSKTGSSGNLFTRPNKGVAQRMAKDEAEWAKLNARTAESVEEKLKRKAEIYDKLQKGKTGGLTNAQLDNLLVDFDGKDAEDSSEESSDEEEETGELHDPSDPMVEITDEYGRTRQVRRSEVPRGYFDHPNQPTIDDYDDPNVLRGRNISNFPVYEPSAERVAKIMEEAVEDPLSKHYDATNENRAKGAAFYQFSADEETRRRQMAELLNMRDETERERETAGVEEGPQEEKESEDKVLSRASAKRKRDLEERRALLDAKRRKKAPAQGNEQREDAQKGDTSSLDAMDFLAKMSRELGNGR